MEGKDKIIKDLLVYKTKTMADQNERSAIIEEEMTQLREEISGKIAKLSDKIKNILR